MGDGEMILRVSKVWERHVLFSLERAGYSRREKCIVGDVTRKKEIYFQK